MRKKLKAARKKIIKSVKKKVKDEIEVIDKFYEQYRSQDDAPALTGKR
ncbi:MAG: hypothetical protein ACE5JK_03790 [Candidatus Omnitrophota bacterium]